MKMLPDERFYGRTPQDCVKGRKSQGKLVAAWRANGPSDFTLRNLRESRTPPLAKNIVAFGFDRTSHLNEVARKKSERRRFLLQEERVGVASRADDRNAAGRKDFDEFIDPWLKRVVNTRRHPHR